MGPIFFGATVPTGTMRISYQHQCDAAAILDAELAFGTIGHSSALLAQLEALDLSGRGFRQLAADLDPAWLLPRAGGGFDVRLQFLEQSVIGFYTRLQHDERLGLGQTIRILLADHGGLKHGLVGDERALDLER